MPGAQADPSPVRLEIRTDASGGVVVHLGGRLDVDSAGPIWDRAVRALPGSGVATLDASELTYCDGAGMSLLHDMLSRQRRGGGNLEIVEMPSDIRSFFEATHPEEDLVVDAPCPSRRSLPELIGARTAAIGADLRGLVEYFGEINAALVSALLRPHRVRWGDVLEACTTAGAFAFPVVTLIGFLLGWVLAFSSAFIMHDYGADRFLAALIGPAMVRELGPLMTCIVLAARSGSAFAAEIGMMKVEEEVDALNTMGIDPVRFLVTPKIIAAVCMTPLLAAFANLAGIIGGALVSTLVLSQPLVVYTNLLRDKITIGDMTLGFGKSIVFGITVAAIGCIRGLQTGLSPSEVGRSTTSAVVTSIVFLAVMDAVMAIIIQILHI